MPERRRSYQVLFQEKDGICPRPPDPSPTHTGQGRIHGPAPAKDRPTGPCRQRTDPRTHADKEQTHGPASAKDRPTDPCRQRTDPRATPTKSRPTDPRRTRADPRAYTGKGRIHGPMPGKGGSTDPCRQRAAFSADAKRRAHGLAMNAAFFRFVSSFRRRGRALPISPDGPGSYRFPSRRQWLPRCPYPGRPAAFLRTWDRSRPNLWP